MQFRMLLALHSPVLLTTVPPRLDGLLHEAACRLAGRWDVEHELPLSFDDEVQGYRASQIIFVSTPEAPAAAAKIPTVSSFDQLERHLVSDPLKRIDEAGGRFLTRLNKYPGYLSPYLVFYGDGDPESCAELIELLDGIGRGHTRGAGSFTVVSVEPDDTAGWQRRSWPGDIDRDLPFDPIASQERLTPCGEVVSVLRPGRVQREVA
ncbi:hypothetical protein J7355_13210 [Endozoicomonas sp. G2_2]|uniref:hypothetical protein n=1 Tax=Endozoicomonas sp. G2_2 TaxID=2821092 RepID=UPI001AD975F3|nr:hypothetical protein [Endozoicomonas sp. G2_2]MBO9471053.1 hypothetical protein [Endozoicomonas sp. G2_2]